MGRLSAVNGLFRQRVFDSLTPHHLNRGSVEAVNERVGISYPNSFTKRNTVHLDNGSKLSATGIAICDSEGVAPK